MSQVAISGNASGTGVFTIAAPNSSTNRTLTLPDGTGTFTVNGVNSNIVSGTAVASTSGTSIDFTGIPSWVKRITVMFDGVSTSGTSQLEVRLGTSGGVEATGYLSVGSTIAGASAGSASSTTGFRVGDSSVGNAVLSGHLIFELMVAATNTWTGHGALGDTANNYTRMTSGRKPLAGALDRVRITTVNGTDTFDAGSINILYE